MLNRTLCCVLEEMRKCVKTLNFGYLAGLIEEAQSMGNRMEAKLEDMHDFEYLQKELSDLKKEIKRAKKELEDNKYDDFDN